MLLLLLHMPPASAPKCWQLPQVFNSEDYVLHVWHVQRFVQVQQKEESKKFSNGQHASLLPRPQEGAQNLRHLFEMQKGNLLYVFIQIGVTCCVGVQMCVCVSERVWVARCGSDLTFAQVMSKRGQEGGKLLAAFACVARVDFLSCSRLRLLLLPPPPSLPAAAPF